ncbi:hypothetical protein UFOVP1264_16 [uncultured Caudovirales phage]|uniref:Uncharacterized protein n=1 Tax=uncultured Caudovirales phage TaxID=2100421 RepID=A0A6J5RLR7_9CAUD|nr:hypothetical protein UFOVP1264_16 [uncultured Caudovirales phage]
MTENTPVKKTAKKAPAKKAVAPKPESDQKVYVAMKPLIVDQKHYEPGDVVPEANSWLRIESWIRARFIKEQ